MNVGDWLRGLGLERYEQTFRLNEIDQEALLDLDEADLETLGLPLGPRKKVLKAITALRKGDPTGPIFDPVAVELGNSHPSHSGTERRQLTVMFCDLVGSTALAARLDPEDLRDVMHAYHTCVAATVAQFGGFTAKYLGDGVLVYFGYPAAHEEDAERAVRAGLALVQALGRLEVSERLHVRIGIATGLAVVGDLLGTGAAQERAVIGDTPNLAARLQSAAAPGTVMISHGTRQLLGNLFDCRDLGAVNIKGFTEPIRAWQVVDLTAVESRFEAIHAAAGLTPLVGREKEIELLVRLWTRAKSRKGQIVLLSGEPGIGKSRMLNALQERIGHEPHRCFRYFCSPYHTDSALYPIIRQLEVAAGFKRDDTVGAKLEKLEFLLARSSTTSEGVTLLAELLSLSMGDHLPPLELTPKQKRERTLSALMAYIECAALTGPVLVLFEDAHWIDPTSIDLLKLLVNRASKLPILAIITSRPEFRPPWPTEPHVSAVTLNHLDPRERTTLAQLVASGKELPKAILDLILARTDGVPLFVEELTKDVLESGLLRELDDRYVLHAPLPPHAIPFSLHASLMSRLDRLGSVKEIAQIGAVIGREFSYELLAAVTRLPEDYLRRSIELLVAAELVHARGDPPEAVYTFKHALVQDAAYASLLRTTRQQLHARIVEVLEDRVFGTVTTQPEILAHHCRNAGLILKAVDYAQLAGVLAVKRSAMAEALAHFNNALGQLTALPEGVERDRREFGLQAARGGALLQTSGWAAAEAGQAYFRASELGQLAVNVPASEIIASLQGLYSFHHNRAESDVARRISEEMLRLDEVRTGASTRAYAYRAAGTTSLFRGEFERALSEFELTLAHYEPAIHDPMIPAALNTPVTALSFTAWIQLFRGRFKDALMRSRDALHRARELKSPYSLAFALHTNCLFNQVLGDWPAIEERSTLLLSLATEQGYSHLVATGTFFQGWAAFARGETEIGMAQMNQGLMAKRAGGAEIKVPYYLGLLADAYRQLGQTENALALLSDALERVERTHERWFEAELHRLRAEVLVALDRPVAEVEDSLSQSLIVARKQDAKLWELRASTSLARLWLSQDSRDKARNLIASICARFEGESDASDLDVARRLRASLS